MIEVNKVINEIQGEIDRKRILYLFALKGKNLVARSELSNNEKAIVNNELDNILEREGMLRNEIHRITYDKLVKILGA